MKRATSRTAGKDRHCCGAPAGHMPRAASRSTTPATNRPPAARSTPASAESAPRRTMQRAAIARAVEIAARPLSHAEILELARIEVPSLGAATVYRTIAQLLDSGELVAVQLPGQVNRYESRHAAQVHHHHFHCDRCTRVFDIAVESTSGSPSGARRCTGGVEALAPEGFAVDRHDIVLYGLCRECVGPRRSRVAGR